jgi:hypothetical protein
MAVDNTGNLFSRGIYKPLVNVRTSIMENSFTSRNSRKKEL